jgi:hypothetical protein
MPALATTILMLIRYCSARTLVVALSLLACTAHAQTPASLDGRWTGTATSATSGAELLIDVEIKDLAGTWTYIAPAANAKRAGACFGRAFPLEIRPLPGNQFTVSVDGARLITGCPVFSLTLVRTDEATLDGTFANGRPAKLVRQ